MVVLRPKVIGVCLKLEGSLHQQTIILIFLADLNLSTSQKILKAQLAEK